VEPCFAGHKRRAEALASPLMGDMRRERCKSRDTCAHQANFDAPPLPGEQHGPAQHDSTAAPQAPQQFPIHASRCTPPRAPS
jgi:hypothetical protein